MNLLKPVMPRLQRGHPQAVGLVSAWPFYEGFGDTLHDLSDKKAHGSLTNMDPSTDWIGGRHGYALDFDGSGDHVLSSELFTLPAARSWSGWFRRNSGDSGFRRFFQFGTNEFSALLWSSTNEIRVYYGGSEFNTTHVPTVEEWHHLIVTHDGVTTLDVYLDGESIGSFNVSADVSPADRQFYLGSTSNTLQNFNGQLDNVLLHYRGLRQVDAQALYEDPWAIYRPARTWFFPSGGSGSSVAGDIAQVLPRWEA